MLKRLAFYKHFTCEQDVTYMKNVALHYTVMLLPNQLSLLIFTSYINISLLSFRLYPSSSNSIRLFKVSFLHSLFSSLLHYNFSALLFFHTSSYISFLISVITSSINSFSHRLSPFLFCPFFHYFFSLFSFTFFFLTFHTTLLSLVCPPVFARVPSNLHPQYEKLLKKLYLDILFFHGPCVSPSFVQPSSTQAHTCNAFTNMFLHQNFTSL